VAQDGWRVRLKHLTCAEDGATATEYAVMFALILVVIFAAVQMHGQTVLDLFNDANDKIPW